MDTGQNDQNGLVSFATVGNLEMFYKAETIYIDRAFFSHFVNIDQMGIDQMGIDEVGS